MKLAPADIRRPIPSAHKTLSATVAGELAGWDT